MKILYTYLKRHRGIIVLVFILSIVNQGFSMIDPILLGSLIKVFPKAVSNGTFSLFISKVWPLLVGLISVAMISRIAKNFQDYFTNVVVQKTGAKMYTDGIKHSLNLPYEVFEDQRSGETLGMLQKVRTDTEKLILSFINIVLVSVIGIVFVSIYTMRLNWIIAPIYFSAIPVIGIVSSLLSRNIKRVQKQIVAETNALAGATTESLRNIELVKSLGLASQEINQLNNTTEKILKLELKKVRYVRSLGFVQGTLVNFIRVCLLAFLIFLVFRGTIVPGDFITLMIYSFFIFSPLQELGNFISSRREAEVSLGNFKQILETPVEAVPTSPKHLGDIRTVDFDQVAFRHKSSATHAVNGVSFTVKSGETVALVGPSGSGKTTLVKLLVGLYQPESGRVLYNGINGKDINLDELREQIGFVTQDTQLFSGTIKENLLFVNPGASDAEIMDVLQKASCQSLLKRADKGIDTMIGEGGVKVSGGEKQRLSIARALLRKPKLMVFDEATSALDSITEEEITDTIKDVSQNRDRSTIMIAHRLSTIMHADRIYVLEGGQIIEQGRHEDLLQIKGLYYAMWRQQIGERKMKAQALQGVGMN